MRNNRFFAYTALLLFILELLLILGSWMVTAAFPELSLRSLIGFDGVRWLLGSFTESLATPFLVWMVVCALAYGVLSESGLLIVLRRVRDVHRLQYRERTGLVIVLIEVVITLLATFLLTCMPHALLLNPMGHLYPSAFSASLVPGVAFLMLVCSLTYGSVSGRFASVVEAYRAMTNGLARLAPLFPLYVLFMQVWASVRFVFIW